MKIRYYEGLVVTSEREVSAEEAQGLVTFTKAFFDNSEKLERTESHDSGKLLRVDYYKDESVESLRAFHLQMYPGVMFSIWKTLARTGDYVWEWVYSFSPSGELTGLGKTLSDERDRQLMQIDMDENHQIVQITKYYWEDKLRYAFEYNEDGTFSNGYDGLYGDHASPVEVEDSLSDFKFYENGWNLPQSIADTVIPPDPQ